MTTRCARRILPATGRTEELPERRSESSASTTNRQCKGRDANNPGLFYRKAADEILYFHCFFVEWLLWRLLQDPPAPRRETDSDAAATPTDPGALRLGESANGRVPRGISANHGQSQTAQQNLCRAGREDALILAAALSYREIMGVQTAFGKRFEDWLRNVQARTKCKRLRHQLKQNPRAAANPIDHGVVSDADNTRGQVFCEQLVSGARSLRAPFWWG